MIKITLLSMILATVLLSNIVYIKDMNKNHNSSEYKDNSNENKTPTKVELQYTPTKINLLTHKFKSEQHKKINYEQGTIK
ncbi:hypothetical protein [Sulfurimonas paralvinellae]|uniref:Uncharacterized protein n=1 Tax=Sulfurimonas paralvinellae TaxID=317658 RepID=A0A7M1B985_9BACT|nr:hypothetical protein [Sulfurimonas paralvinellae]QOP46289.1 hypothetical protein FM071_08290 [Sulfurimonas paralvinellae]